jgi:hypothetical protein
VLFTKCARALNILPGTIYLSPQIGVQFIERALLPVDLKKQSQPFSMKHVELQPSPSIYKFNNNNKLIL